MADRAPRGGSAISPARAWTSLGIIIFLYTIAFIDRQIIALLVEPMKRDLDLTDAQVGALQGLAFSLTYCLVGLPVGWLVDRYPRRLIIGVGVFLWSLAAMSTGFARSFAQLFAARAAVGVGEATLGPASFSLISDAFPRERLATALSFYTTGANIGGGLAFLLGGLVVGALTATPRVSLPLFGEIASWQAVFVVIGLPGIAFALLAVLLAETPRPAPPIAHAGSAPGAFAEALRQRRLVIAAHWTAFPLLGLCAYSIAAWLPAWGQRTLGWGPEVVGPLLGASQATLAVATTLAGGFFTDRLYRRGIRHAHFTVPAITCSAGAALVVLGLLGGGTPALAFWTVVIGSVIQSAFGGAAFSSLQLVMPSHMRGRASAIYIFILSLVGFGIGPVLVGWLTGNLFGRPEDVGRALALVVAGATAIAVVVLVLGRAALASALEAEEARMAVPVAGLPEAVAG